MGRLEVLCLGSGDALSSTISHDVNASSTSFIIMLDEFPVVLIGAGPGTLRSCLHFTGGRLPTTVVLLTSSLEQCGDLPLIVQHQINTTGKTQHIFTTSEQEQLKIQQLLTLQLPHQAPSVHFIRLEASGERTSLAVPSFVTKGSGDQDASFKADASFRSMGQLWAGPSERGEFSASTTEGCVMVMYRDRPALSIMPPIPTHPTYPTMMWLANAPVVLSFCSCKRERVVERPQLAQLVEFVRGRLVAGHSGFGSGGAPIFGLVGWGHPTEAPKVSAAAVAMGHDHGVGPSASISVVGQGSSLVLVAGDFVTSPFSYLTSGPKVVGDSKRALPSSSEASPYTPLSLAAPRPTSHMKSSAASGTTSPILNTTSRSSSFVFVPPPKISQQSILSPNASFISQRSVTSNTSNAVDIRKVFVYDFDNKAAPGKQFLLRQYRKMEQFESAVSMQLNVKPLKALLRAQTGERLRGLDGLVTGDLIVAIRHGGGRYGVEEMPRGLAQKMSL